MLESRIVNAIGLVMVLAGCALLYYFGLPPDFDPTGVRLLALGGRDEADVAKGKRYRFWGRAGFVLIAVGSLFQIGATWLPGK